MNKKFDYILLPPDGFHRTFDDLLSKSFQMFLNLEKKINKLSKENKKSFIIKYRTKRQRENFSCYSNYAISYGKLLNYCHEQTIVIGPCGTAMLEVLHKKIQYYPFDFFQVYKKNRMIINNFTSVLNVAKSSNELLFNIKKKILFKPGFTIDNLILSNGVSLDKIVKKILNT